MTNGYALMDRTPNHIVRSHCPHTPICNSAGILALEIERCRQHISKMARQGRQHEGARLVLTRLERRLLEVNSFSGLFGDVLGKASPIGSPGS